MEEDDDDDDDDDDEIWSPVLISKAPTLTHKHYACHMIFIRMNCFFFTQH